MNEYDKFIRQQRVETLPLIIKEASDIKMAISFNAVGSNYYVQLSGSGIGAALIDVKDKAVFVLENGSTVTSVSKGYQNYDIGTADINYNHDYVLSLADLEKLRQFNVLTLKKSRAEKFDDVVISKEAANQVKKLSSLFIEELKKGKIIVRAEEQSTARSAGFPGGNEAWVNFLKRNLQLPLELGIGEKKTILVQFLVNTEGIASDFQIVQSGGVSFDNEALRVLRRMPKWKSAIANERPADAVVTQPISFFRPDPSVGVK